MEEHQTPKHQTFPQNFATHFSQPSPKLAKHKQPFYYGLLNDVTWYTGTSVSHIYVTTWIQMFLKPPFLGQVKCPINFDDE